MATRPEPAPQPKPKKEKRDWEKLMFENTEEGVETLRKDIKEEVTAELRAEYSKVNGEKEFWQDFYTANDDLKKEKDDDLVRAVLNKNMAVLGDLPVSEAIKKLGDLTRERILAYTGTNKKPTDKKGKANVESGGTSPIS